LQYRTHRLDLGSYLNVKTPTFIFDMDGTMVDSMPFHQESWLLFAKRYAIEIDMPDLMARTTGRTGSECMEILFGQRLSASENLRLLQEKESLYRDMFAPQFRQVEGFKEFAAKALATGIRMGVGTAGDQHNIAFVMRHLSMATPPEVIVGGDEGLPGKPEPAIFLEVAKRLGVEASNCIVFEDAPFGIEAARRGGMKAVAICTSHTQEDLGGPHVLAAVPNFLALLESGFIEGLLRGD
jgi:beta-phosphoglucomutase-like phosphatase (HAD superfamily)